MASSVSSEIAVHRFSIENVDEGCKRINLLCEIPPEVCEFVKTSPPKAE